MPLLKIFNIFSWLIFNNNFYSIMEIRRNRPGTRASDLWNWKHEDLTNRHEPFAVREYLQEKIRNDPSDIEGICKPPEDVDENLWQYEHIRQFLLELNLLVVQLQGIWTSQTCPKMKATEDWLYLCASHDFPQEWSAMDYMIHNLEYSTRLIHNSKVSAPGSSTKYLLSIVRRIYRFFTHWYFHHRETFVEFENVMHLWARFTHFATIFKMMSQELFIIPNEVKII